MIPLDMRKRSAVRRAFVPAFLVVAFVSAACGRPAGPTTARAGTKVAFASMSFEDALGRARVEKRLLMVDVYTDWCGWCRKLEKETYGDTRVADALGDFITIRVDAEKGGETVAERYGVRGFPTVLFLSGSGDIVRKVEGFVDADEMLKVVTSL
jgi:thiol:disulfide interchange protein